MLQTSLYVIVAAVLPILARTELVTVTIDQGTVTGNMRTERYGGKYFAFRSIPYAKPPINELRFMPPVPHGGWDGVRQLQDDLPICFQSAGSDSSTGTEDCLYLSVFTRRISNFDLYAPVQVVFHGGGFRKGDAQETIFNSSFPMGGDIVLVTAHYRLGIFGFFDLGIGDNSQTLRVANAGMKDQVEILRWIQKNIAQFGGDPERVILTGESAGGVSAHLHMFSPLSSGLFNGVIAQSGSATNFLAIAATGSGKALANEMGITVNDFNKTLTILQSYSKEEIVINQRKIYGSRPLHKRFFGAPVIEESSTPGAFITQQPVDSLKSGMYTHVPLIMGYNDEEGILVDRLNRLTGEYLYMYDNLKYAIPYNLNVTDKKSIEEIVALIKNFYFDGRDPSFNNKADTLAFIDLMTDTNYFFEIHRAVEAHARNKDLVYYYRFSADTRLNFYKQMNPVTAQYKGACHGDDLGYLFGNIYQPSNIEWGTVEDTKIREMMELWTNFMYCSNPTPPKRFRNILGNLKWNPVSSSCQDNVECLSIDNGKLHMISNPDFDRITFWKNIYNTYGPK